MHHDRYSVSDPFDSRFRATGVIECEELVIDLQTESESGDLSVNLWAPDHLRKIMAHFVPRYKSVRTSWCVGDNLVTFNRAIAAGATPEEAAIRTLTGHQLALAGYSRAEIRFSRRQSRPVHESRRQFSQTLTPSLAWIAITNLERFVSDPG
jgi:hypothetical protein